MRGWRRCLERAPQIELTPPAQVLGISGAAAQVPVRVRGRLRACPALPPPRRHRPRAHSRAPSRQINPGSSSQIAAATTLSFLFLQLYLFTRPYSGKRTRLVASYAYFSLLAFFFIALLLKQKISVSSGNDKLVFSVLVGALTTGAFSTPVLVFLESLRRVRFKNRYMEQYR